MKKFFSGLLRVLKSNMWMKIASLVFAFVIWSYVLAAENPLREITVHNVKVSYVGAEELSAKGLTVSRDELVDTVDVTLNARQNYHKYISEKTVQATVDLSEINNVGQIELQVEVTANVVEATVKRMSTSNVVVHVDDLVERVLPVRCELQGKEPVGYYVGEPVLAEETVVISGPRQKVEQISEAVCYIPVEGMTSSVRASYVLTLFDKDGNQIAINELDGSVPSAIVELEILPKKEVPIDVTTLIESVTNVKDGYEVVDATVSPG
ncbi:MAG: hypothetical protein IJP03_00665, partial [Christensenellaceae bacterium]|nr:hypothetical protein [Christensenellaceae bacterium]